MLTKLQVQFVEESLAALLQKLLENHDSALNVLERATACADALAAVANFPKEQIRNAIIVEGFLPQNQAFSLRLKLKGVWVSVRVSQQAFWGTWLIDGPAPDFDPKYQVQASSGVVEVILQHVEVTAADLPEKFVEAFQNMQAFIEQEAVA